MWGLFVGSGSRLQGVRRRTVLAGRRKSVRGLLRGTIFCVWCVHVHEMLRRAVFYNRRRMHRLQVRGRSSVRRSLNRCFNRLQGLPRGRLVRRRSRPVLSRVPMQRIQRHVRKGPWRPLLAGFVQPAWCVHQRFLFVQLSDRPMRERHIWRLFTRRVREQVRALLVRPRYRHLLRGHRFRQSVAVKLYRALHAADVRLWHRWQVCGGWQCHTKQSRV